MSELKNTIKLLRLPFSIFLLPVSLFSFFYIQPAFSFQLFLVIAIWHLLVFPSSNGYNSYQDQDEGPIGGLAAPPKPTKLLLHVSNVMDASAIVLSFLVNTYFAFFVAVYIIASRLYSNRTIRFKKLPIVGFLIVFIFQGAWIFCGNIFALSSVQLFSNPAVVCSAIASSFFIATIYPLTQIYQHEADQNDGVTTLSMLLGIKGTFLFSMGMFLIATLFIYFSFNEKTTINNFWLFNMVMLPSTIYFFWWALKSFKDATHVNFKNTMMMLVLSSLLNNLFFFMLLLK
ncbi:MAG: prenyltransferase [Flavobacterium sp. BFFFF2]|nr:MAG: prenyltransferase [Flavobacterium sp. BFFFF2]